MEQKSGKIYEAIPAVMRDVGAIGKGRRNPQQGYQFRGIDDVYNALQPVLAKHGVFVCPSVVAQEREERKTAKGGTLIYTILTVKHTVYAADGSSVDAVTVGEAMDSGDKSANKAMSAAMKYALLEVFAIPTEGDNDTENQTHEVDSRKGADDFALFKDALDEAFKERKFDVEQADAAIAASLRQWNLPSLAEMPHEYRMTLLEAVRSGKADKFKNGKAATHA